MSDWMLPPEVMKFAEAANRFVSFIETSHEYDLLERLVRCAAVTGELFTAGLYLPLQDVPEDPDELPSPQPVRTWIGFEELTMFWQVPDAFAWAGPVVVSLSDLLLDTHRDIKRGLLTFHQGNSEQDAEIVAYALWYWRDRMEKYWGAWTSDALRALNRAIQKVSSGERDF
ncbi:MAG: DUF5063 domain-containing protein [Anaerolinea sp.]|nr:DUF5063 domain-containing protein [Anaerolinea sp.]MCC6972849.1 DUF5063 domain-containing protein [Anaerolineae bacterium]CAG0974970.1 hypothetical protein ANRL4_01508 [Anaerolineae bacterium]